MEALGLMSFEEFIGMLGFTLPAGDHIKIRHKWNSRIQE